MAITEKLEYLLSFDTRSAERSIKKFGKEAGQATEEVEDKAGKISTKMIGAGAAMVSFAGVAGTALWSVGKGASDLNESINATEVTFGDAADGIKKLGNESARALGLSKGEFLQMSTGFAAFAKQIAGEGGDIVGVIDGLTTRASDFASVMNLDVNRAMTVFRSGLAGETESLRQFGIDVSAATVELYAMENGLASSKAEMTEAVKQQARYGVIMEQTEHMAGDFANTSGDLANAQRILSAELKDLSDNIGTGVLPFMTALVGIASDVMGIFTSLSPTMQATIGSAAGMAVAFVGIAGAATAAAGAFLLARRELIKLMGTLAASGWGFAVLAIGAIAGAIMSGVVAGEIWETTMGEAAEATDEFTRSAMELAEQMGTTAEDVEAGGAYIEDWVRSGEKGTQATKALEDTMLDLGVTYDHIATAALGSEEAFQGMRSMIVETATATGNYSQGELVTLDSWLIQIRDDLRQANIEQERNAALTGESAEAAGDAAAAYSEETGEILTGVEALRRRAEQQQEAVEAAMAMHNSDLAARRAAKRAGEAMDDVAAAGMELYASHSALAEAQSNSSTTAEELAEAEGRAAEASDEWNDSLMDGEAQAMASAEAARQLAMDSDESGDAAVRAHKGSEAYRAELQRLADKAEGPLKAALEGMIADLDEASGTRNSTIHFHSTGYEDIMAKKRRLTASSYVPIQYVDADKVHGGGMVQHGGISSFGGLRHDEVPAVLQEGEAVLTPEQQSAMLNSGGDGQGGGGGGGHGGPVTVNVASSDPKMLLSALREVERMTGKRIIS